MKQITSIQNTGIKELLLLQDKAKIRKKTNRFVIEGKRELSLAVQGSYILQTIFYCPEYIEFAEIEELLVMPVECIQISKEVYQKIAYRDSTEGVIAIAVSKQHSLDQLELSENPLILVAEGIEKPGNVGALLRTADAAKVDAIILANPLSDLYNPNTIRSSVGCLFTTPIAVATSDDAIAFLKNHSIEIYSTTLQNSNRYDQENYKKGCAIVVGTEATGLTQPWRDNSTQNIIIPMQGIIDSMNVSVAAAVVLFEAKRQRNFE